MMYFSNFFFHSPCQVLEQIFAHVRFQNDYFLNSIPLPPYLKAGHVKFSMKYKIYLTELNLSF